MRHIPANPTSAAEVTMQHSYLIQAWMALYTSVTLSRTDGAKCIGTDMIRAKAYLHAKREMDASQGRDDDLPQTQCVATLSKVVDYLDITYDGGDMELGRSSLHLQSL